MERVTERTAAGVANINYAGCKFEDGTSDKIAESARRQIAIDRLASIEDILGDDYDLYRLRELVEADRDGRCIIVPVKPGGFVRFKGNPRAPHEKVDGINIYADGKIMLAFHEYGVKETFVDEWSEDEAEKYISVEEE